MSKCLTCKQELDTGTISSMDCGGDCMKCMASFDDPHAVDALAFERGFNAACDLLDPGDISRRLLRSRAIEAMRNSDARKTD